MKTPEQEYTNGGNTNESSENVEALGRVVSILRETSDKLNSLKQEADTFQEEGGPLGDEKELEKLMERAELFTGLSRKLADDLANVNPEHKQKIEETVGSMAFDANELLQDGHVSSLSTLQVEIGEEASKNSLDLLIEGLIESIEKA